MNIPQLNTPQKIVLCLGFLFAGRLAMFGASITGFMGCLLITVTLAYITGPVSKYIIKSPKFALCVVAGIVTIPLVFWASYFSHKDTWHRYGIYHYGKDFYDYIFDIFNAILKFFGLS